MRLNKYTHKNNEEYHRHLCRSKQHQSEAKTDEVTYSNTLENSNWAARPFEPRWRRTGAAKSGPPGVHRGVGEEAASGSSNSDEWHPHPRVGGSRVRAGAPGVARGLHSLGN